MMDEIKEVPTILINQMNILDKGNNKNDMVVVEFKHASNISLAYRYVVPRQVIRKMARDILRETEQIDDQN